MSFLSSSNSEPLRVLEEHTVLLIWTISKYVLRKRSKILQPSLTFSHGMRAYLPSQVPHLLSLEAFREVQDLKRTMKKGLGTPEPVGKRSSIQSSFSRKYTWLSFQQSFERLQEPKKPNPTQNHGSGAMVYKCKDLQAHHVQQGQHRHNWHLHLSALPSPHRTLQEVCLHFSTTRSLKKTKKNDIV